MSGVVLEGLNIYTPSPCSPAVRMVIKLKLRFHTLEPFGPEVTHIIFQLTSLTLEAKTVQHPAVNTPGIICMAYIHCTNLSKATRDVRKQRPILHPCAMHKTLKTFSYNRGCLCLHSYLQTHASWHFLRNGSLWRLDAHTRWNQIQQPLSPQDFSWFVRDGLVPFPLAFRTPGNLWRVQLVMPWMPWARDTNPSPKGVITKCIQPEW